MYTAEMLTKSSPATVFLVPSTHKFRSQLISLSPVEQSLWLQLTVLITDRWDQNCWWSGSYYATSGATIVLRKLILS